MNPRLPASLLALVLLTNGCGILMPKQVELFQRKVKPVPEFTTSAEEVQRQAADRIHRQTEEALQAALLEHSSTNITAPLYDSELVADALADSLGPPSSAYSGDSPSLADELHENKAELDRAIEKYADNVEKDVGKKIEGTGLIRVGYFTMLGGILLLLALAWFGLRVYGIFNPVVGGVTSVIGRASASILHKGFTQVVAGGEHFKDMLEKSNLDQKTADYVKQLFAIAQKQSQDEDVKTIVSGITKYPDVTPPPMV